MIDRSRRRRLAWAAAFALLFAAGQALLWIAYYANGAKPLIGDEQSYQDFALSILAGGTWMPSSIWPPLQSLLLAAIYRVAGVHVLAVQVAQTILLLGCALLLRSIWRKVGGSVAAANLAATLFLLNPATAAYAHWLWPEIVHLTFVLAAFWLLAEEMTRVRALVAGACIGLALLAKSLLAAFWPLFLIAFVRRNPTRLLAQPALLFVLGLALVTAPALWHGWREYGKPMIADSSVYNLWVGLTDRWRSDYVADMGGATLPAFLASADTPQQRNAIYKDKIRALVDERGAMSVFADQIGRQYFRLFNAKTPLLSQLPGPICAGHLSVYRTPDWLTRVLTTTGDAFHILILAAAAFGIACWRRRPDRLLWLIALYAGYQLALLSVVHVKARFLLPMMPFLCGFAGSFLVSLRARDRSRDLLRANSDVAITPIAMMPLSLAAGALLAVLLLFLAFGGPALDRLCAG
jgi:4-amino-4-deoxy-L-arabinose transferase-like glycosyltransferase